MSQLVSHREIVEGFYDNWELNPSLFNINVPYKKISIGKKNRKRKLNQVECLGTNTDVLIGPVSY